MSGERGETRPDEMEPYTARAVFIPSQDVDDVAELVAWSLTEIGRGCEGAGSSIIGHIKAHVRTPGLRFHCNLTSLRSGARCGASGPVDGFAAPRLEGGASLEVDLAVLVYGLAWSTVDEVVRGVLDVAATRRSGEWRLHPSGRHPHGG